MRKKRMEVKICLNFEAIPPNHLLIILHEDECFFLFPSKGDVQARKNGVKLFLKEYSFVYTLIFQRIWLLLDIIYNNGLKHFWRSILIFVHFMKMNVFTYMYTSKGDVQARHNGVKSFLKEYSYFSYSSWSWMFLLILLSISGTCVMITQKKGLALQLRIIYDT